MKLKDRITVLEKLGKQLQQKDERLEAIAIRTEYENPWFTQENIAKAIKAISESFLEKEKLNNWTSLYKGYDQLDQQTVGLVLAGNIPLVGFHDVLCVFVVGHRAMIKLSEKDKYLLAYLIELMIGFDKRVADYFEFVPKLKAFDAVIATGSNNSARYFELYFSKYPHIIRKNRNAIAVLDGTETEADFKELAIDIFQYFGLGCRNVSKLYVPQGYDFNPLLEVLHSYKKLAMHSKYKNNFDYNYALFILNNVAHYANGCILLTENKSLASRIATLHFEYYSDRKDLQNKISQVAESIQCVVSKQNVHSDFEKVDFGKAQTPALTDYADGVDTMQFLLSL
ncbi:MAG TPA: acyl-CoA reductase [Saprospiraceae bacterium]|nr:acyl-CoA reductase [Saprospiraceae bacterium]